MIKWIFMADDKVDPLLNSLFYGLVGGDPTYTNFIYLQFVISEEHDVAGLVVIDPRGVCG